MSQLLEPPLRGARNEIETVDRAFRRFVQDPAFSCLAGKGLVEQGGYRLGVYDELGSQETTGRLAPELAAFAARDLPPERLTAFVAVFTAPPPAGEREFESRLWKQLQRLHETDGGAAWAPQASPDPEALDFAFSFAGQAYFVIGLHPKSSRFARRFRWPALVFNPHEQFERLRAEGRFERLRGAIRQRELVLQGSLNPNLADFGEKSEARQYSGRAVEPEWRCPFRARSGS